MSEFLGARISLISKSDIRYSGVLHEINSEESTVSLENVISYGTEGRKGKPEEEIAPADQIYEYIVFRGSDVKDLRIEEGPGAKENKPPAVPNDPAILGARPRPGNAPAPGFPPGPPGGPGGPGGPPGGPGFGRNMHMPPPHAGWGPPGSGPGGNFQYPPPPGWFPPGPGYPPAGPGPWNNFYAPGPGGPPGPQQGNRQPPPQTPESRPAPIGANVDKQKPVPPPVELGASEPKSLAQIAAQAPPAQAPAPPVDSKPSVEEVKATAASLSTNGPSAPESGKPIPTGPRMPRIMPAVPLPAALVNKAGQPSVVTRQTVVQTAAVNEAALRDATQAAKAAVAVAMANMAAGVTGTPADLPPVQQQHINGNAMDNLTKKVNEMRVNARDGNTARGGRGRGGRPAKVDVPDSDFDFASSNAKFNKEDVVKEAIAGSPLAETPGESISDAPDPSSSNPPPAYNKTRSFFDNISSEAKERSENGGQKPGGREWRGEEQRKNMETFGQGSVDSGYRNYRGRGRGRGGMRGRGGYGRGGGRGGFRRNDGQPAPSQ